MTSNFTGSRVVAGQLLRGYAAARERLETASREQDPDPGFFALFESLNWAVAVDDYIRKVWVPHGEPLDFAWRSFVGGEELEDLLNGTRYARNVVHHHWADALRQHNGFRLPFHFPLVFFTWTWRNADELPEPDKPGDPRVVTNREAYSRRLAGVRATDTMLAIGSAFEWIGTLLDPPRANPPSGQ